MDVIDPLRYSTSTNSVKRRKTVEAIAKKGWIGILVLKDAINNNQNK